MAILLVGGTGTIGAATARALLGRVDTVAVLSRSRERLNTLPFGVEGRLGDASKPDGLKSTLADFESVFLVTGVGPDEADRGIGLVRAAKAAGCKRIVYLSAPAPSWAEKVPAFAAKRLVEQAIRDSGLRWTVLRPNHLFQNDIAWRGVIERGFYPLPLGSAGVSRVDVRDVAEVAAAALTTSGHNGQSYRLDGPDPLTGSEVAAAWRRHLGRSVVYAGDSVAAWVAQAPPEMPRGVVDGLAEMYHQMQIHGLSADPAALRVQTQILGRSPRSFEGFAAQVAHEWNSARRAMTAVG
ncbi:MAG: NAD(P)H-binding protein [Nitrospirota bacterium]|nr:NAD(P)H-binding protein [Nitrospirota bacterium]